MGVECRIAPACLALLLLGGCGGDDVSDLNKYIQEVKARPKRRSSLCRKSKW